MTTTRPANEWNAARAATRAAMARETAAPAPSPEEREEEARRELARQRRDSVVAMLAKRQIEPEQFRAALEIGRCFEAVTRAVFAVTTRLDNGPRGAAPEDWPASLVAAWRDRYRPWAEEQGKIPVAGRVTRLELCIDIIVEGRPLNDYRRRFGMRHEETMRHFREALYRYAEMAQWVRPIVSRDITPRAVRPLDEADHVGFTEAAAPTTDEIAASARRLFGAGLASATP